MVIGLFKEKMKREGQQQMSLKSLSAQTHKKEVLRDLFGRTITTLRISVTDRCNLRCLYCMPELKMQFVQRESLLTFEEIYRISKIFVNHGVDTIRITGGEPLVRRNITTLLKKLNGLKNTGLRKLKMTTNGILLKQYAPELATSGIDQINVSMDTLNPTKFQKITQLGSLERVLEGIKLAQKHKIKVKVNVVALKGFNDSEIFDFINFSAKNKVTVRFIELMPFNGNKWNKNKFVSKRELLSKIEEKYEVTPLPKESISQTSTEYKILPINATIGFIASVTESFCSTCSRIRLTAEGFLRPCLHSNIETNLREPLRKGCTDEEIAEIIKQTISRKPKEHEDFLAPFYIKSIKDRPMIKIGG